MDDKSSSKRSRFVRLAEKRVAKAIKTIRAIGALSDRARYEYSERDAEKIVLAFETEVSDMKTRFGDEAARKGTTFSL
ncbi:MAG: hypothetical protein AB7U95_23385 [Reyranella sp.]